MDSLTATLHNLLAVDSSPECTARALKSAVWGVAREISRLPAFSSTLTYADHAAPARDICAALCHPAFSAADGVGLLGFLRCSRRQHEEKGEARAAALRLFAGLLRLHAPALAEHALELRGVGLQGVVVDQPAAPLCAALELLRALAASRLLGAGALGADGLARAAVEGVMGAGALPGDAYAPACPPTASISPSAPPSSSRTARATRSATPPPSPSPTPPLTLSPEPVPPTGSPLASPPPRCAAWRRARWRGGSLCGAA